MSAKATSGVEVVSLGCRMNLAESERMQAMLAQEGDLVVINSCAVTAEALRQTRRRSAVRAAIGPMRGCWSQDAPPRSNARPSPPCPRSMD
jgi:tRNA A37 methylthiotransferase MiaB